MEDFLCNHCGNRLEWIDTYDCEGGISEGYYIERQFWSCDKCGQGYVIQLESELKEPKITHFEES